MLHPATANDYMMQEAVLGGIWKEIKTGFNDKFLNGDAESKGKYTTAVLLNAITLFNPEGKIGDLGKVDKVINVIDKSEHVENIISRIKEIVVTFNYNTKYDKGEFARQLADQEAGMNKLTVDEYLKNRERYIAEGRSIEGNMAQQGARKEALANKIDELLDSGMSYQEAESQANKWLESQAALHNPDQIAGGNPQNIGGMGDKKINSSIGSQWKYRIDVVDEQIQQIAKNMTEAEKKSTYLNVKLTY